MCGSTLVQPMLSFCGIEKMEFGPLIYILKELTSIEDGSIPLCYNRVVLEAKRRILVC